MGRSACIANILAVAAALACSAAMADTVILKSGDTFSGTITRISPDAVDVDTPFAGKIAVKRDTIRTLRSENKVNVVDPQGAAHATFIAPLAEGAGWREANAVAPALAPVAVATPPAALPPEKVVYLDLERYYLPIGPHWKNQFVLGLVNTSGNTDSTNFSAEANFKYKESVHELTLKIGGVYDVTEGRQTAGQFYFDAVYRRTLSEWDKTERWYFFAENHDLYDAVKGISYRVTNAAGLGYYLVKSEKFNLDVRGGPAFVCEKFFDGDTESAMSALAGLRATYVFNERTSLSEDFLYTVSLADAANYQITSETALNLKMPEIARGAGLKLAFRDDYDNSAPGLAKQNDTRFTVALTLDF